jgi:hypothetical protein
MRCTSVLKTTVPSDIKIQVKAIADRELLSEAAWLKLLVVRQIQVRRGPADGGGESPGGDKIGRADRNGGGRGRPLFLDARAEGRGMRPATYASILLRAHLRQVTPLPKDELLALKRSIAELAAIGRNINQIAKAANDGGRLSGSVRDEFRAILKICEALRDNTKALLKANVTSWNTGHV